MAEIGSDYKDDGTNILLDANENAYGPGLALKRDEEGQSGTLNHRLENGSAIEVDLLGLNRYPDPHQEQLKQLWCNLRNTHKHTSKTLTPENLFVGVGSDEVIDALLRCFCIPSRDKILTCPPTYGMYAVSAQVNDIEVIHASLDADSEFSLQPDVICRNLSEDKNIKLVYICSPGNPTANVVSKSAIEHVLQHPNWNGVVVLDEAYIDFAPPDSSLAEWVSEWPNLVVMQTISKAFGLAGIRLGVAFTSPPIARLLNNLKAPYNVSNPTSQLAIAALSPKNLEVMQKNVQKISKQRQRLIMELPRIGGIGRFRGGFDSNFLLVEILSQPTRGGKPCNETALKLYESLAENKGVVVRFRGKEHGCIGCLRVTVGTEKEVDRLLEELEAELAQIYRSKSSDAKCEVEKEQDANGVIA